MNKLNVFKSDDGSLFLGDCLTVLKQLKKNSITLAFTSPPYFNAINYEGHVEKLNGNKDWWEREDVSYEEYKKFLIDRFKALLRVIKPGGFNNVTKMFDKQSEDDAPYIHKVLAEKYDAIQLDMAYSSLELMKSYVSEILTDSGYNDEEKRKIANKLVTGCYTHGEVINLDKARVIGLKAFPNTKYLKIWNAFRELLGKYVIKSASKHIIRYWINKKDGGKGVKKGARKRRN